MLAEEEFARVLDHGFDQVARAVHRRSAATAQHLSLLEHIFEGGDDKRILGREMMQLRAAGQAGFGGDIGGPKAGVAAPANEFRRSLEDARPRFLGALGLGSSPCGAERSARGFCGGRDTVRTAWHFLDLDLDVPVDRW